MIHFDPDRTVAMIDIGSNSVRLVIFRLFGRLFQQLHNEKVACGLGEGVAVNGILNEGSVLATRKALVRYRLLCDAVKVDEVHVLATAALREAENGAGFLDDITQIVGTTPILLKGEDEARLASAGAMAGSFGFKGIVGDLGGGSLELAYVQNHHSTHHSSFKLGALRLKIDAQDDADKALVIARERLKPLELRTALKHHKGAHRLTAIGGTWRALAKVLQVRHAHPLSLVHQYQVSRDMLIGLCQDILRAHRVGDALECSKKLSKNRKNLLPFGAASMIATLEFLDIEVVEFSAYGLREGYLFDGLSKTHKTQDPLLLAARHIAHRQARSPDYGDELFGWTGALFHYSGLKENEAQTRLRHAACLMSDLSWWGHPNYRARQSVDLSIYNNLVGLNHEGRGYIAIALAMRQSGAKKVQKLSDFNVLSGEHMAHQARILGAAFRLAHALCGSHAKLIKNAKWAPKKSGVVLKLDKKAQGLMCDAVRSRAAQLSQCLELDVEINT